VATRSEKRKAYERAYYQAHKKLYADRNREWQSKNRSRCVKRTLKHRAKNLQKYKAYQKVYGKVYRQKHGDKLRAQNRQYGKEHYLKNKQYYRAKLDQRRAIEKASSENLKAIVAFRESVKSKPFATCYYCEKTISTKNIHFDHIVALIKGGPHSVENLCVSCSRCNRSKGAKTIKEWLQTGQQFLNI
jgi:5-methylcytosine-specific restriction endonuclease McrA